MWTCGDGGGDGAWGWQGLGVEARNRRWGEREARRGSWREGGVDMGRRWPAWRRVGEQERRWWGLGVEDPHRRRGEREARLGSWGEGQLDTGRQGRAWCHPWDRERKEPGPGGLWWRIGELERRE